MDGGDVTVGPDTVLDDRSLRMELRWTVLVLLGFAVVELALHSAVVQDAQRTLG